MLKRLASVRLSIPHVLLLVLALVLAVGAAQFAVVYYRLLPYRIAREVYLFARGHPDDQRSLAQRFLAEVTHDPAAFAAKGGPALVPVQELMPVRIAADAGGVMPDVSGMTFYDAGGPLRHFVVYGSFVFPGRDEHWGAIAIDSNGTVHRGWPIRPEAYQYRGGHIGLAVTGDGLLATNAHGVLSGYSWCGEKAWQAPWEPAADGLRRDHDTVDSYDYHHDVVSRNGRLYTFLGVAVVAVDERSGEVVEKIHALDLIRWARRDGLSIFEGRRKRPVTTPALSEQTLLRFFDTEPFHFNKVDVLTADQEARFPGFRAGDLLLSLRELNLVVAVRPAEERILWWRYGLSSAQHDATFSDGAIELFDNNPGSDPPQPRLLRLNLAEQRAEELLDLSRWKMEMRVMGNFERHDDRVLTVDTDAGRAIAGRLDGSLDFVLENGWRNADGNVVNLQLMNATELPDEQFQRLERSCDGKVQPELGTS